MYAYEYMQFVDFAHLERSVTVAVLGGGEQQGHQVCREMLDLSRVIHLQPNARAKIHVCADQMIPGTHSTCLSLGYTCKS